MSNTVSSLYVRFPEGRSKVLTFSYDDGMILDPKLVKILNERGLKGTFNISGGLFFEDITMLSKRNKYNRMTKEESIATYADTPHEIAIHAYSHPDLTTLPTASVVHEIIQDRECLEATFGRIVRGMAYPYGTYNDAVVDILKACGIVYSRTVHSTEDFDLPRNWLTLHPTCHHENPRLMELAKKFVEMKTPKKPKMFYLWGHTYEFGERDNWNVIEEFADFMAGREDEIWYATNIEIYEYVEAFDRLVFSADSSVVHNPTSQKLWYSFGKDEVYSIEPGETVKHK